MSETLVKADLYALIGVDDDIISSHLETVRECKNMPGYGDRVDECFCSTEESAAICLAHDLMLEGQMDIKEWKYSLKT